MSDPVFDHLLDEQRQRKSALTGALTTSVGTNPDAFATQKRVAGYLGYPVAAVEAMPDLAEQAKVLRVQNDITNAPTLKQRFTDADFAKLAHDDSGVLSTIETSIARGVRYLMGATPTGGVIGTIKAAPDRATQSIAGVKAMGADIVEPWARLVSGKDNQVAQLSAYYKALAKQAEARGDALDPPDDSVVGGGLSGGVNSLLQSSKYLPIALAGGPVGAVAALGGMVAETIGQSYLKADAKGLPLLAKLIYGISDGVVEYATEKGPLGALVHSIKAGTPLGKAILQNAMKEMKGEQTATVLQDLNEWAALNPDKPFTDYLAERPDAAAKTAIGVLVGAAGNTSLAHSMQRSADMIAGRDRQAEYNVAQATALQEQLQAALNSKLRERSPDEFRAAVQAMADGAAENDPSVPRAVFVDAEVLNQLSPEVQQLLPAGVLDQMAQALATGDAVEIPIGDALAIAPGTPLEQMLVEHGRIGDPSMPSQFETKQAGEQAQQWLATEAQGVIAQAADAQAMQDSSDRVGKVILDQLQATGRFRQAVNEGYATWAAAFYTTMAGRMGMTPEEMHAKYPLRIVGETGAGEVMDQGGRVVYRGRMSKGALRMTGGVSYFTDDRRAAQAYIDTRASEDYDATDSNVMEARLDLKNPAKEDDIRRVAEARGIELLHPDYPAAYLDASPQLVEALKAEGYDGAVGLDGRPDTGAEINSYAVFDPTQIKTGDQSAAPQTETAAFKRWFGDSKVVDEQGKPLVVYHGTNMEFDSFSSDAPRQYKNSIASMAGFSFSSSQDEAQSYGRRTIAAYLSLKNPARFSAAGVNDYEEQERSNAEDLLADLGGVDASVITGIPNRLKNAGVTEPEVFSEDGGFTFDGAESVYETRRDAWVDSVEDQIVKLTKEAKDRVDAFDSMAQVHVGIGELAQRAKENGHDGAIFDFTSDPTTQTTHYMVFRPEQIKSSIGNSGAFDPANPSILEQSAAADGPAGPTGMARDLSGSFTGAAAPDPGKPTPRGTFNPQSLELALNENANLTTFFHESGHFFLEVMADMSSQPDAPAEIAADMGTVLAWFGVPDLESWRGMTLAEQRPYHERFAESIEQYVMEGRAPSAELQPLFRKFRAWVLNVYRSAKAFIDSRTGATEIQLSDEVRKVFDRMLASQEQIQQAEEVAGMMPNTEATADAVEKLTARSMRDLAWTVRAVAKAVKALHLDAVALRREVRIEARAEIMSQPVYRAWQFLTGKGADTETASPDPKQPVTGGDSLLVAIAKMGGINRESARRDAGVHPDYHRTASGVFGRPIFRLEGGHNADDMAQMLAEAGYLETDEHGRTTLHDLESAIANELGGNPVYSNAHDYAVDMEAQRMADGPALRLPDHVQFGMGEDAVWRRLSALGMTSDTVGLAPDFVADAFEFENGTALARALAAAESPREAIERLTDQRMLEQHGELLDEASIQAAANQAVHNEARARSLATELKAQAEMANPRTDTGQVNAKGSKITVNAIVEAAKQFAANVVAGTPLKDMKALAWKHTAAERRANTRWQKATMAGDTAAAVKAKQDQVLHNAAAKGAMDAMGEANNILAFFKKVTAGSNEKTVARGRDPDVVNAARAILAAYGVGVKGAKSALDYLGLVEKNDPAMFAALQPSLQGALNMAQPLASLTMEELQGLHEEIQAMWHLAKRSRQMEVQGNLMDIDDAADELSTRMAAIGVPLEAAGTNSALTPAETRTRWLQFAGSLLRRVEQWAEGMDGKYGGPFLKLVFGPVKAAADAYRADRAVYRKAYQTLVDTVAPALRKGLIEAPELGYTFGKGHNGIGHAELLHAILHTGNASNKRKLLLGRNWATENADGTMDAQKWDAFIQRMHDTGVLGRAHYDFAQGVWDLLERTKPLAQKAHRDVFGRYFAEVTADAFDTPFGSYRGGYVPAQADPRIVQDADMRNLASLENESMSFSFPATNKGFTKGRVEYNRPLMLDLRTIGQHIDKVLLFAHMEPAVRDVNKLLSRKPVSQPLGKIDPTIYAGMLTPWLNRSARQVVETPIVGDGGISRVLSAARSRAGMALMFANVSNTLQQTTGFATAFAKLKSDGMRSTMLKSAAMMISIGPKKMAAAVAAASPFMANRMANEIAAINGAMNDILLDPSLYERAQEWTARHAYFLQSAMDNTMGPIIWTSAYNAALNKGAGMSPDDAVRYADGVIRQTQGSTLPEDVSRIETGPAYARVFTQFIGYFNMMANTNSTMVKQIAQDVGLKRGAGKALGLVTLGMMVPIWVAEAIAQAMRGGPDDPDEDGYLDDWLMAVFGFGTIKGAFAMVPFVGQLANAGINRFNGNPADDKMSLSPAVSLLEAAVGVPVDIYKAITDEVKLRTLVRDVASAVSIATGLPAVAIARPLGYLAGVEQGQIAPTSAADAVRGAITGSASPDSKQ